MLRFLPLLLLASCSLTLPVRGRVVGGDVELIGDATGSLDGSGTIRMTASDGRVCNGTFQYATSGRQGSGTFTCQDGTTGTLVFNSTGRQGTGFGNTSRGERIRFAFGSQATADFRE